MSVYDHEHYLRQKRNARIAMVLGVVGVVLAITSLILRYFG